jgi:hypothetical protein
MEQSNHHNTRIYPSLSEGFGIVLIFILLSLITGLVIASGNLSGTKGWTDFMELLGYLLTAGGTLLVIARIKSKIHSDKPIFNNYRVTSADFIIVFLLILMIIIVVDPLTNIIPVPEKYQELFESIFSGSFPALFTAIILAPVLEELIFRGIILEGFLRHFSPVKAIVWCNVLFGMAHLNPWQFLGAFIIGIFISWVYFKTRNLILPIFIHFINNLVGYLFILFTDIPVSEASFRDIISGDSNYYTLVVSCFILLVLFFAFSNRFFPIRQISDKSVAED